MNQFFIPIASAEVAASAPVNGEIHTETGTPAESHAGGGLSIDPVIIGIQALNLLVLLVILYFILLKPLIKMLNERSKKIEVGLQNADKAQKSLEETNMIRKDILKDAQSHSLEILEKGKKAGDEIKATILLEAHKEATSIIEKAKQLAEMEKSKAMKEFQQTSAQIILKATEKFLREKMDPSKDLHIIEQNLSNYFS